MDLPEAKTPNQALIGALSAFVAGWLILYWIVDGRAAAVETKMIALNSQQSQVHQDINGQLAAIRQTLGAIDERTKQHGILLDLLRQDVKRNAQGIRENAQGIKRNSQDIRHLASIIKSKQ